MMHMHDPCTAIPSKICTHATINILLRLQDEEISRQELEDTEVDIRQEDIRRLIMEYMVRTAVGLMAGLPVSLLFPL